MRQFVRGSPTCNQHKPSHQAQAGPLHPLPIPSCPWSHISLDFVIGLPPLARNSAFLTVIDRFGKMAHFIPLKMLPLAKETAKLLLLHVVRLHGIPIDIVSDRGLQVTSAFWREFCSLLGASVSLSSGFHPQSNGQSERKNQDMETSHRCLASPNPSSWSQHLVWVEYAPLDVEEMDPDILDSQDNQGDEDLMDVQDARKSKPACLPPLLSNRALTWSGWLHHNTDPPASTCTFFFFF